MHCPMSRKIDDKVSLNLKRDLCNVVIYLKRDLCNVVI